MGAQREALNGTGERLIMKAMMFIIQVAQCGPYKKKGLTNASAPEVLQVCGFEMGIVGYISCEMQAWQAIHPSSGVLKQPVKIFWSWLFVELHSF